MDLIRSCYSTVMVLSEGGPPVPVRWYRCGPEAIPYPGQHCFGSLNDDDTPGSPLIGEQRGFKVWDPGMRPAALAGNGLIVGEPPEFSQGSPAQDRHVNVTVAREPSLPICRQLEIPEEDNTAPNFFLEHQCGRIRIEHEVCPLKLENGNAEKIAKCFDQCPKVPFKLKATIPAGSG